MQNPIRCESETELFGHMSVLKAITLSLISVLQEQVTALSTVQENHLNVCSAS